MRHGTKTFFLACAAGLAWAAVAFGDVPPEDGPAKEHPRWNPAVPSIGAKNLLPNGSFECGPAGWSTIGKQTAWGGDLSSLYGTIDSGTAFHGRHSLRIELGPGKTPVTHFDGWPSARVVQAAPLATNVGWLQVEKGEAYTLSAYLRADRPGVPAVLVFRFGTDPSTWAFPSAETHSVTLGEDWMRHTFTLKAAEPDLFVSLGPDLTATPEAEAVVWIDAVQLEKAAEATDFAPRETVELGIDSGRPGNVFSAADGPAVTVYGANGGGTTAEVVVTAQLEDYFGKRLPSSRALVSIPPADTARVSLPLTTAGLGHYRARITWTLGSVAHEESLILGVIEPYTANDSVFGVNHAPTTPELSRLLRQAGIVWARDTAFDWNALEPAPGQRSFEKAGIQINREAAEGYRSMAILPLHPSTQWNSSAPADVAGPGWIRLSYAPTDPALLYDFVGAAVAAFKGRIRHYEFINEPVWIPSPGANLSSGAGYTVADYIALLKGGYAAMKAADPDCRVLGGLSIQAEMPLGDRFMAEGGLRYCDIYNLHPYPTPNGAPERFVGDMKRILAAMDAYGGRKPIWATETAYFAEDDLPWTPWVAPRDHNGANNLTRDERSAADYSVRHAVILLAHGVEKIFYHQGIEGEANNGSMALDNPLLGILSTPDKFYVALAALANALGEAPSFAAPLRKPEQVDGRSTEGVYGFAFDRAGGGAVLVVWTSEEPSPGWALDVPANVLARDVVGNPLNSTSAPITGSPLYLSSRTLSGAELAAAPALTLQPAP